VTIIIVILIVNKIAQSNFRRGRIARGVGEFNATPSGRRQLSGCHIGMTDDWSLAARISCNREFRLPIPEPNSQSLPSRDVIYGSIWTNTRHLDRFSSGVTKVSKYCGIWVEKSPILAVWPALYSTWFNAICSTSWRWSVFVYVLVTTVSHAKWLNR